MHACYSKVIYAIIDLLKKCCYLHVNLLVNYYYYYYYMKQFFLHTEGRVFYIVMLKNKYYLIKF